MIFRKIKDKINYIRAVAQAVKDGSMLVEEIGNGDEVWEFDFFVNSPNGIISHWSWDVDSHNVNDTWQYSLYETLIETENNDGNS